MMRSDKKGVIVLLLVCLMSLFVLAESVTDYTGEKIFFQRKPTRIVAALPSDAEMLFDLGLGDRVVGVNDWADYPKEVKSIEKIGGSPLNIEKIVSLKPDVVLANVGLAPNEVTQLRKLGIVVLAINPTNLKSTLDTYLLVGKALGAFDEAKKLVEELEQRQANIKPLEKTPKIFVEIWNDPLMTAGKGSLWDDIIVSLGGKNIGALAEGAYPVFSEEELIKQNPDLIVLTNYNLDEAKNRPTYVAFKRRLFQIDPALFSFPTKRLWDGLEVLYEKLKDL